MLVNALRFTLVQPLLQGPGLWAGIDASGSLFELGWPKVASLLHGVWAAQYQAYLEGLQQWLAGERVVCVIGSRGARLCPRELHG